MTSTSAATNVIPQIANVQLTYPGSLASDSRDGQGVVCRRLQGAASELFKYCALEHVAVSDPIEVVATVADGTYEHGHSGKTADKMAGLDMFIDKDTWQMG